MKLDTKNINKILANQISKCIKRIIYHNQARSISSMQDLFYIQKLIH